MLGESPVSVQDVVEPLTVLTFTPSRNTSYPVTPTLSVDAVHDTVTDDELFAEAPTPDGTLGACVFPAAGGVVTVAGGVDCAEVFGTASNASTV